MSGEMDVWKMIHAISNKSVYPLENQSNARVYVPWIANRFFASFIDTFEEAATMNSCHFLDNDMQIDYMFHSISPKKRYKPWLKKSESDKKREAMLEDVAKALKCSKKRASEYMSLLNDNQKKALLEQRVYLDTKNSVKS